MSEEERHRQQAHYDSFRLGDAERSRLDREAEARLQATEDAYFASFQASAATNQTHPDSDSESDDWDAARARAVTYVANIRANPALAETQISAWRPVLPTERILYGDEIVGQTGYTMSVIKRADIT